MFFPKLTILFSTIFSGFLVILTQVDTSPQNLMLWDKISSLGLLVAAVFYLERQVRRVQEQHDKEKMGLKEIYESKIQDKTNDVNHYRAENQRLSEKLYDFLKESKNVH